MTGAGVMVELNVLRRERKLFFVDGRDGCVCRIDMFASVSSRSMFVGVSVELQVCMFVGMSVVLLVCMVV